MTLEKYRIRQAVERIERELELPESSVYPDSMAHAAADILGASLKALGVDEQKQIKPLLTQIRGAIPDRHANIAARLGA